MSRSIPLSFFGSKEFLEFVVFVVLHPIDKINIKDLLCHTKFLQENGDLRYLKR